jgi:hypothetical protein
VNKNLADIKIKLNADSTVGSVEIDGRAIPSINKISMNSEFGEAPTLLVSMIAEGNVELEFPAHVRVQICALDGIIDMDTDPKTGNVRYTVVRQQQLL